MEPTEAILRNDCVNAFLAVENVTAPTSRQMANMLTKFRGILSKFTGKTPMADVTRILRMWVQELTGDIDAIDVTNAKLDILMAVLVLYFRRRPEETIKDHEARMHDEVSENVELFMGSLRLSRRLEAEDQDSTFEDAIDEDSDEEMTGGKHNRGGKKRPKGGHDDSDKISSTWEEKLMRHLQERDDRLAEMEKMLTIQQQQHLHERRERDEHWAREMADMRRKQLEEQDERDRRHQKQLLEQQSLQGIAGRLGDSDGEVITALQKMLADKELKLQLTDSEDEESCERTVRRRHKKTQSLIPEEQHFLYPYTAAGMKHSEVMAAWMMEMSTAINTIPRTSTSVYDDAMMHDLKGLLKLAHKAMLTSEGNCRAWRATGRLYQAIVDLYFQTITMARCPMQRRQAQTTFQKELTEARDKERNKDDVIVKYNLMVENVVQKTSKGFSSSAGRHWGQRAGGYQGPRRSYSSGRGYGNGVPSSQPAPFIPPPPQRPPHLEKPTA